jgi:hypothetical protein
MPIAIARTGYHGAAMGNEAVRFLVVWMTGWVNSRQLEVNRLPPPSTYRTYDFATTATGGSTSRRGSPAPMSVDK